MKNIVLFILSMYLLIVNFACKKVGIEDNAQLRENATTLLNKKLSTMQLPNGGTTPDGSGNTSGVNSVTGLSQLTKVDLKLADGSYYQYPVYVGTIWGQTYIVFINTYPATPILGAGVDANMHWNGGTTGNGGFVIGGNNPSSSLTDGSFQLTYNVWNPSSSSSFDWTSLMVSDPSYNWMNPNSVKMVNPNFSTSSGGSGNVIYDNAKIICTGDGGFAFTEIGFTPGNQNPPNTICVGLCSVNGLQIWMYAPTPTTGGTVSNVKVLQNNVNIPVKVFNLDYTGDINNGFHTTGIITLSDGTLIPIDTWIYP